MKPNWKIIAPLLMLAGLPAQADVWKCIDEQGGVAYTNTRPDKKGCKLLSQDQAVSTINTKRTAATPGNFPKVDGGKQKERDLSRRQILEKELAQEQEQLDRAQKELAEQKDLVLPEERIATTVTSLGKDGKPNTRAVPSGAFNGDKVNERLKPYQDRVAEHQRNVEAIRQEIGKLK